MVTKYIYFCTLLSILCCKGAAAQSGRFEIGLNCGPNITSLHGDHHSQYFDWNYSAVGMLYGQYHFNNAFSLYTNLGYEIKGCKGVNLKLFNNAGDNLGSNNTFNYRYTYITVPLLFRYTISTRIPFFVNAGPYAGYMLKYEEKFNSVIVDRTKDMQKTDFGVSFGAGLLFPLNDQWSLSFELRNNMGLTNIRKSDDTYKTAPLRPTNDLNPVHTNSTNILFGVSYTME